MGGCRNGKSLQSVLRASEEVVHISYHAAAQETVPTQLLAAAHITQHFLLVEENGTFPPPFYGSDYFFPEKSYLVSLMTLQAPCRPPYPGTMQGTPQKADLCRAANPILSPKLHHPQISLVLSRVQK